MTFMEFYESLKEPTTLSFCIRLTLAMICGGLIGLERGRKRRPAGFRTYMLVCMGASLAMIISQYLWANTGLNTDLSRLGAQVINGIGFLGAGTIMTTGKNQVKGLTTAAGLWASACMGLAIGAGFYFGALLGCFFIVMSITVLSRFERKLMSTAKNMNIYLEFKEIHALGGIIEGIKTMGFRVFDVEITRMRSKDGLDAGAILSLRLDKKRPHAEVLAALGDIENVSLVEEL
jgi:putative Mg2+ transporter-C (MgtC) family protein